MNQSRQTTSFPMHTDGKPRLTRSHPGMPIPRPGLAKLASGNAPYIAAFASVCLCAAGLIFRAGPWQLWVGLEFIFTAAIAFKSIPAAVGILILISPYNSIIRSVAGDGAFVRGFRDLLSYLIFAVFWLQCAGRVRNRTHSSIALLFVGWCVLVQIVNSHGLTASLLGVRQLVQFFLLFPIVVAVVSEQGRRCAANLLGVIVVTAGVMSLVQLANHFEYIHLPIAEGEGGSLLRNFQGRELVRMIPIVEISPSGLAIYMISASVIVIARIIETRRAPLLWIGCLAGPLVCAVLSLSHTCFVATLVGLGVVAFCGKRQGLGYVMLGAVFVVSLPTLFGNASLTGKNTADYSMVFIHGWKADLNLAFSHPLFGAGASPGGYLAELLGSDTTTIGDGGWALLARQVGIPMGAMMFCWAVSIMWIGAWNLKTDATAQAGSQSWMLLGALAAAAVYFVNAHGVPWYRVGADVNFIVLAGILAGLTSSKPSVVFRRMTRSPAWPQTGGQRWRGNYQAPIAGRGIPSRQVIP